MRERLSIVALPLLTLGLIFLLWELSVRIFEVPGYIIPPPEGVGRALYEGYVQGFYWKHIGATLTALLLGYATGCSLAILCGCLFAESKIIERMFLPYVIALQSMPKVALAPLIVVWFGFDLSSKVVMVALICFFPVFVNTIVGLRQADPNLIDLMRALSASRWQVLFRIKIPSAAGHIFAALQISVALGLIGAVVAEFVSSTKGLGFLITNASVNLDTGKMFGALVTLAIIGVTATQLIRLLHARLVFWDKRQSHSIAGE